MNTILDQLSTTINPITGRTRAPSTAKNYLYNVSKLSRHFTSEPISLDNLDFLLNAATLIKYINLSYAKTTAKNHLTSIIAVLQVQNEDKYTDAINIYLKGLDSLVKEIISTTEIQTKTPKQTENWTTMKSLKKVATQYHKLLNDRGVFKKTYDSLPLKDRKKLTYWLIASLYTSAGNPPVRATYANMSIITEKNYIALKPEELHTNYLVLGKKNQKYFSFNSFKNVRYTGLTKVPVARALNRVLNKYFKLFSTPPEQLLINNVGMPMNEANLSATFTKVFDPTGKHITLNLVRHIFISELLKDDKFIDEKKHNADMMMHTTSTQELYRKK
mgnify:CR=1 FL=1